MWLPVTPVTAKYHAVDSKFFSISHRRPNPMCIRFLVPLRCNWGSVGFEKHVLLNLDDRKMIDCHCWQPDWSLRIVPGSRCSKIISSSSYVSNTFALGTDVGASMVAGSLSLSNWCNGEVIGRRTL